MLYYLAGLGLTKGAVFFGNPFRFSLRAYWTGGVCQSLSIELSLSNLDTFMLYYLSGLGLTKGAVGQRMLFAKGSALLNFPFTFLRILPYFCSLIRHYAEAGS
jgi:hypothetical protein